MATLETLLEALGGGIIHLETAPNGLDVSLSRVVIYDATDRPDVGPGDLVLCVGISSARELAAVLELIGAASGTAMVAKRRLDASDVRDANTNGVAVLSVPAGTAWSQVVLLSSSVLASDSFGASSDRLAGAATGDLFSIANVIADLVDAPITIEDPQLRVVAFSGRQEEADAARAATIMGRQVPHEWTQRLRDRGILQRLAKETGSIYIEKLSPELMPRAAVAVRSGDEVLGSIWAAVHGPLSPDKERALEDAAGFVALHMLRHRVVNDIQGGLQAELLGSVLQGGTLATLAAARLSLPGTAFRVVAVALQPEEDEPSPELEVPLIRCRDMLSLHLSTTHRGAAVARLGSVVYAIVPVGAASEPALAALRDVLERFVARAASALKMKVRAGIGSHAASTLHVPRSRDDADMALRVLREAGDDRRVVEIGLVRSSALLLQFADEHRDDPTLISGPLQQLREYDRTHRTAYVATLKAYLDAFGDVERAARVLKVHANTIRYRVRQLPTVVDIDLEQPAERLALLLQLHLLSD